MKIIELHKSVTESNDRDAEKLRNELKERGTFLINVMSSPGAGKTTLLSRIITDLKNELRIAVMEADIDASVDAEKIEALGARSIQLHTDGMCHMDAGMTRQGIEEMGIEEIDLAFLENVGNLICPAEFDTGASKNMTILSVPEGHDKPLKYPLMYETCDLLVINKTDVMDYFDFDKEKVVEYARMRNPEIEILYISAKTGEGIPALADWIIRNVNDWNK
jgi:hydrogenase nickel incorporation protein HypB